MAEQDCTASGNASVLVVIPVYNHAATVAAVARAALAVHPHILVVDDGSTDIPHRHPDGMHHSRVIPEKGHPLFGLPVFCVRHARNMGKGAAITTGAAVAKEMGMSHIVTIDADGQHDPADIPLFLAAIAENPLGVFVGERNFRTANVPFSTRFGRSFSNFWFKVHTGTTIGDVQSGFRAYPLTVLGAIRCTETRYSFEVEVLVRANWAGFAVKGFPIRVHYPPKKERVSHFHPFADNFRISLLNTRLTIRSIMPLPQKKFAPDGQGKITPLRPIQSLRLLLADNATPRTLALGAAVGMGLGTLPLVGLHSISILLVAGAIRVNKIAGLAVSQLCMPPFVPALCIEVGHYLRHGRFLTEISLQTLGYEALDRIWEWVLGSLVLAPLFATVCGVVVWCLAYATQRALKKDAQALPSAPGNSGGRP